MYTAGANNKVNQNHRAGLPRARTFRHSVQREQASGACRIFDEQTSGNYTTLLVRRARERGEVMEMGL